MRDGRVWLHRLTSPIVTTLVKVPHLLGCFLERRCAESKQESKQKYVSRKQHSFVNPETSRLFRKAFSKQAASRSRFQMCRGEEGVAAAGGALDPSHRRGAACPSPAPVCPIPSHSWGWKRGCGVGCWVEWVTGSGALILTLASVLINQEYGLYHLKQWSYFSLANYCCSAETQQLSMVLVPPRSNSKVNHSV